MHGGGFDYRAANVEEVIARARSLEGLRLASIPGARFDATTAGTGRQEVGLAVERFFGIPPNSLQVADFPAAGLELKVVPLRRGRHGIDVNERTVLSMIDYDSIASETWDAAKIRSKLHILFVFFEHLPGRPKGEFPILRAARWAPSGDAERFIRADWLEIRRKVRAGQAHLLSEADGRVMGPCTKAADSSRRRRQPFSAERAKPRAFALKPAFVRTIYLEAMGQVGATESLLRNLGVSRVDLFERSVLNHFAPYVGKRVAEVGDALAIPRSRSKNYAAAVARVALGAHSPRAPIEEFELTGLIPRVVRCRPDLTPYEATSFPKFRYGEVILERWEESDLLARISYMLFIPVIGPTRDTPAGSCIFGMPVFWRPSKDDLSIIEREWKMYVRMIADGKADRLPGYGETHAIHVRPHGRDASDTDIAPGVGPLVKKSFWLNPSFVRKILSGVN